jgi:hypothetical protein
MGAARAGSGSVPTMHAQYNGKCKCGRRFSSGSYIKWDPEIRKVVQCDGCRPVRNVDRQAPRTINKPANDPTYEPTAEDAAQLMAWFERHPRR